MDWHQLGGIAMPVMTNRGSRDFDQGLPSLSGGSNFPQRCERLDADLPIYFVGEINRAVLDHCQERSESFMPFAGSAETSRKFANLPRSVEQSDRNYPR